jgi:hypothetical protein
MHPLVDTSHPEPTSEDRFAAVRSHVHDSMRYHANAIEHETDEEVTRLLRSNLSTLANVMALLEGPRLDDRSMLARRERLTTEYARGARDDPTMPGVCSFCGARTIGGYLAGPSFKTHVRQPSDVRGQEAYIVCDTCLGLIEADDRRGLAERSARRYTDTPDARRVEMILRDQHESLWSRRDQR